MRDNNVLSKEVREGLSMAEIVADWCERGKKRKVDGSMSDRATKRRRQSSRGATRFWADCRPRTFPGLRMARCLSFKRLHRLRQLRNAHQVLIAFARRSAALIDGPDDEALAPAAIAR